MLYLTLSAGMTRNGGARRCYMVLGADGGILDVIEDRCAGDADVRKAYPTAKQGPQLLITPREYRDILRKDADWREAAAKRKCAGCGATDRPLLEDRYGGGKVCPCCWRP